MVALVQTAAGTAASGTTVTATRGSNTTAGHLLIAFFAASGATVPTWPSGWNTIPNGSRNASGHSQPIYYQELRYRIATGTVADGNGADSKILTVTYDTSSGATLEVADYSFTDVPTLVASHNTWDDLATALWPPPVGIVPTPGYPAVMIGTASTYDGTTLIPGAMTVRQTKTVGSTTWKLADRIVASAAGPYPYSVTNGGSGIAHEYVLIHAAFSDIPTAVPGGVVEWDDAFVDITGDIKEWTISRGASAELTGGSQPGSATITLINAPSDDYNPENASGPNYGLLHDGPRVWIGVNEDGTVTPDPAKDVYGLFAGRITDLSPMPVAGAVVAPTVELVCADPLEWMGRQRVTLADSTTRSQYDLRLAVLDAIGDINPVLAVEPTTLPLSGADGFALNILDSINAANGTRHFAKPADDSSTWYHYTTVRRTELLDGTSDASASASSEHVTGTSGFRVSADGVINKQKASVDPIVFPGRVLVWQPDLLPFSITGTVEMWTQFGDYVGDPEADVDYTGSALTVTLEPFGDTAKLTLVSAGTSSITSFDITGYLVQRGSTESVVIDDLTSQATSRGVRAGSDLTGDYLGTLTSASGFASHIVWRFGSHLYRPTITVENWFPEMFDLDLFDRISLTIAELSITSRIFEIVGLTLHSDLAALDADGNPVVHHTATYVLQESRVQTPTSWFTWDVTEWDDATSPWAY